MTTSVSTKPRNAASSTYYVAIAMVAISAVIGWSLATVAVDQFLKFGSDTPYVTHLLALDAPATSDIGQVLGPAGGSVDNLLLVIALLWVAVAASLMVVSAWLWLTPHRADRESITHRVTVVGLWMSIVLAVAAFLPIDGTWQQAGLGQFATGQWNGVATRVLLLAVIGLLVLQAARPQVRPTLRDAFRE